MTEAIKFDPRTAQGIPDPTTESGEIFLFEEALGQNGRPFVFMVEDPPNKTRPRHSHHGDVLYVYVSGEHHIEGEGSYRAGDVRWTRAGHVYGPETTGPDGGSWWVISYSDPIPVNALAESAVEVSLEPEPDSGLQPATAYQTPTNPVDLPKFERPYDWDEIDEVVRISGGVILEGLLNESDLNPLNNQIDEYLTSHEESAAPASGSAIYDVFLGHKTLRLHGLLEKVSNSVDLIGRRELIDWAERLLKPVADSILLNAGELIQIQPGEPAQFPHRDSDSWPVPVGANPIVVNAIVALDACTLENGATYVAPGSWQWQRDRQAKSEEFARAVMKPGDALLFRGDLVHGGGENDSQSRRRAFSISYCAGWLRPVENSFLNLSRETVQALPTEVQGILGFAAHDGSTSRGGMLGLFENGNPAKAIGRA